MDEINTSFVDRCHCHHAGCLRIQLGEFDDALTGITSTAHGRFEQFGEIMVAMGESVFDSARRGLQTEQHVHTCIYIYI